VDLRYVIDASVGVKWAVPEEGAGDARLLRNAYAAGDLQLLAPDLYLPEVANTLWKKHRLRGELTGAQAVHALELLLAALPAIEPAAPLTSQALELATQFGRPVYDCIYVALALRLGCPLITADVALARHLGPSLGMVATPAQGVAMLATARVEHQAERSHEGPPPT
jgi:predicted nucleic acid-binding protein